MVSRDPAQLRQLARIARIKADIELRRFAAFRSHVAALDHRITDLEGELAATAAGWARLTAEALPSRDDLRGARLAYALTRQIAGDREAARDERHRLTDRFDAARTTATRAFGRAEALDTLDRRMRADRAAAILRRLEGG